MKIDWRCASIFIITTLCYIARAIYLSCTTTDTTMIIIYFILATLTAVLGCIDQLVDNVSRLNDKIMKLENDIKKIVENDK